MYCIRCGKRLQDGAQCCTHCGTPVAKERKAVEEDGFTIPIPEDFIQKGSLSDELPSAKTSGRPEQIPDEEGDASFTLMMSKDEIREAMAEQKKKTEQQPQIPANDITDIPIPASFIVSNETSAKPKGRNTDVRTQRKNAQKQVVYHVLQEDSEPEPIMNVRSILIVVFAVIILFAVAVGAFVMSLTGGTIDSAGSGSGTVDVGFWSEDTAS